MKRFLENDVAVAPVIGSILMVGMSMIMVSAVAISVFAFSLPVSAPQAKIVVAEATGGVESVVVEGYYLVTNSKIVLKHKGGDALAKNNTKIIIRGMGLTYTGIEPYQSGPTKDIIVTYGDLSGNNYNPAVTNLGEIVKEITWDAGETVTLYGTDGTVSQGNTVDSSWMLNPGSEVRVTIIDLSSNEAIATSIITVN